MSGGETARRRRPVMKWALIGVFVLAVGVPAVRFSHLILPSSEQASCTATSPSERHGGYRSRDLFPHIGTDCGSFAAEKEVTCSADPSRTVMLLPGTTYDLTVAGPRIPFLSQPTVLSAKISTVQKVVPETSLDDVLSDDVTSENLRELREQFSPEGLRAFDYVQPPYDPQCDVARVLMTTEGAQIMHPAHAERYLEAPEGVTPRDPKLPCDDWYYCEAR